MNQILYPGFGKFNYKKKKIFVLQFVISIIILVVIFSIVIIYINNLTKQEDISRKLTENYDVYKLYSDISLNNSTSSNNIFGIIEIKKINIYYPIFNEINENLLKIAPCKFYGDSLYKNRKHLHCWTQLQ